MRIFRTVVLIAISSLIAACDTRIKENSYSFPLLSSCRQQVVASLSEFRGKYANELTFDLVEFDEPVAAFRDVVGYVVISSDSLNDAVLNAIANNPILDCYPTASSIISEPIGTGKVEEIISLYSQMGSDKFYVYIEPENIQVYSSHSTMQE